MSKPNPWWDGKSPLPKPEAARPDVAVSEAAPTDVASATPPVEVAPVDASPPVVAPPATSNTAANANSPPPAKPARAKKPVPKQAIVIGIAGGAALGAVLAWGVLSFIWWRRDVNQDAEFNAQVKADQEAERRRKAEERNDPMRSFSIPQNRR